MKVSHYQQGSGEPVYLVAGLGQVGERWHRVVNLLAENYRVVTLDNRETGGTGPSPDGFLLSDLAQDVLDLATDLGDDRFFLAGISMGGMIAQEILRAGRDRIRAAALLATHGGTAASVPADPGVLGGGGARRGGGSGGYWGRLAGPGYAEANPDIAAEEDAIGARAATPAEGYMRQFQAISQFDAGDALVGTDVPLIVLHGNADPLVPYENGVRLAANLGVELVTFEGSGHWLEVERAAEVSQILRDHFAKAAAQGR